MLALLIVESVFKMLVSTSWLSSWLLSTVLNGSCVLGVRSNSRWCRCLETCRLSCPGTSRPALTLKRTSPGESRRQLRGWKFRSWQTVKTMIFFFFSPAPNVNSRKLNLLFVHHSSFSNQLWPSAWWDLIWINCSCLNAAQNRFLPLNCELQTFISTRVIQNVRHCPNKWDKG